MNISLNIQDTENNTVVLQNIDLVQNSLVLNYSGSDEKTKTLIASQLQFVIADTSGVAGTFKDLYTANETRYLVTLQNTDANVAIWSGYLMAESYGEVYKSGMVPLSFQATDGFGFLKAKYFDAATYNYEYSIVEILCKILQATGLELDLYLCPAITNAQEKDYNKVYLDLAHYNDAGDYTDLYTILDEILTSMCCSLYQAEGAWYVVGWNKRSLTTKEYKIYNTNAELQNAAYADVREVKEYLFEIEPYITVEPPLGAVLVEATAQSASFPETLYKEDIGVTALSNTDIYYQSSGWHQYFTDFAPKVSAVDNGVYLPVGTAAVSRWVGLKKNVFLLKDQVVRLKMNFELITDLTEDGITYYIENGGFSNLVQFHVKLNNQLIYSDAESPVSFGSDLKSIKAAGFSHSVFYEFRATENGYLDVFIIAPAHQNEYVNYLKITDLELENRSSFFPSYYKNINYNYTTKEEITLPITVDNTAINKSFLLQKQKEYESSYAWAEYYITLLYSFVFKGQNFAVVSLYDLSVIKNNPDQVFLNGTRLENLEMVFNFNRGEQMVLLTDDFLTESDELKVFLKPYDYDFTGRTDWEDFTDDVYPVSLDYYTEVVATVYERLFSMPGLTVDGSVYGFLGMNSFTSFRYQGLKTFYPTNISWNVISGITKVFLHQDLYAGFSGLVDTPVVEAGNNVEIEVDNYQLNAIVTSNAAYTLLWEDVTEFATGNVVFSDATALNPVVSGFVMTETRLRVTVTNEFGFDHYDELVISSVGDVGYSLDAVSILTDYDVIAYVFSDDVSDGPGLGKSLVYYGMPVPFDALSYDSYSLVSKRSDAQLWRFAPVGWSSDLALNITYTIDMRVENFRFWQLLGANPGVDINPTAQVDFEKNNANVGVYRLSENVTYVEDEQDNEWFGNAYTSVTSVQLSLISTDVLNIKTCLESVSSRSSYVDRVLDGDCEVSVIISITDVTVLSGSADVSGLIGVELINESSSGWSD